MNAHTHETNSNAIAPVVSETTREVSQPHTFEIDDSNTLASAVACLVVSATKPNGDRTVCVVYALHYHCLDVAAGLASMLPAGGSISVEPLDHHREQWRYELPFPAKKRSRNAQD
jgi:hypothetical protein